MSRTAFLVNNRLRNLVGDDADIQRIERRISELQGEGNYERIVYVLVEDGEELVLPVTPIDKYWGPHFLRLSDDFDGGSAYLLDASARTDKYLLAQPAAVHRHCRTRDLRGEV